MIHSDVGEMSPIVSHVQYKYFVTFINDYSCLFGYIFSNLNPKCFLHLKIF